MEEAKKPRRVFSSEQKFDILQKIDSDVKSGTSLTAALDKQGIVYSAYYKWKRQLSVGIKSSLRNGKPPVDKEKKRLAREIEKLKEVILSQSEQIAILKKETNWD